MHNNKKTFNIRFKLVSKTLLAGFNYAYFIKIELATNRQCYFLSNQYHGRYPIHPSATFYLQNILNKTRDKFFGKKYSVQKINLKLKYIDRVCKKSI